MNTNFVMLMLSASLLTGSALAGTMSPLTQKPGFSLVGTLSAGPVLENGGTTKTFYLAPGIEKTYTANQASA